MIFVDTHAHLYSSQFAEDCEAATQRALQSGVRYILLPDVDSSSRGALEVLAARYPDICRPMVGLHPTSVNDNELWREELLMVEQLLRQRPKAYCAVGEIGIDLYWSRDFESEQREAFTRQVELALEYNLPVAIHSREAWDVIIELLTPFGGGGLRGVIHAFTGELKHYEAIAALGDFVFGIGGVVTFKKSPLAAVVAQMPLSHIVLETDAPYLTPTPHRGKRNEPSYVPLIARYIAQLHAQSEEVVAEVTTRNANRIFNIF